MSADPQTLDAWAEHVGDELAGGLAGCPRCGSVAPGAHSCRVATPVLEVHIAGVTGPVGRELLTAEQFAQFTQLVDEGHRIRVQFDADTAPMRQLTAEDSARRCR